MFELYKQNADPRTEMLSDKHAQVEYLYNMAADREDNCLMDGVAFAHPPRIFDRKITSNAVQTLICEVIDSEDHFEAGSILDYDGDKWLCTSSYVFHDNLYCRGNFYRCNYKLRWQKSNATVVERYIVVQDATAYNSGVEGNKTLQYGSDQQMVWITCDSESVIMERDKRFFIDNNTANPTPYILTRIDTTTRTKYGVGYCIWLLNESQYDESRDNIEQMLCDYIDPSSIPHTDFKIEYYGQPQLRVGGRAKSFTAVIDRPVTWSIEATTAVSNAITLVTSGNTCTVKCKMDESLIGSSFKLVATLNNNPVKTTIDIIGGV